MSFVDFSFAQRENSQTITYNIFGVGVLKYLCCEKMLSVIVHLYVCVLLRIARLRISSGCEPAFFCEFEEPDYFRQKE